MTFDAKITVEGGPLVKQTDRVEAVEAAVRVICEGAGTGPDDGIAVLLTAAACIAMERSPMRHEEVVAGLIGALLSVCANIERVDETKPEGATAH